MYRHAITYKDFDGNERTENMYFNLTATELGRYQLSKDGGLAEYWQKIIDANDGALIMDAFRDIVLAAYGEKSDDGRYFMKTDEIRTRVECSAAFDAYMLELADREDLMMEFANSVVPKNAMKAEAVQSTENKTQSGN